MSRYEQMPRWYVSSPGMKARNLKYTDGEDLAFVSPFTRPEQWKRFDFDKFDPWTPGLYCHKVKILIFCKKNK